MKSLRTLSTLVLLAAFAFAAGGCINQLNSNITPGTNTAAIKKIYVVHLPADGRGIDKLIADHLKAMGREATSGDQAVTPADVDAVITYQDKWQWDITMYMLQLDVQLRNPKTQMAMATAHAMHTSLTRKSPPEMVDEVLGQIFK